MESKPEYINKQYLMRQHYIDKIKPLIDKNIIKVIVGQRRVGKSYMLFQIIDIILQKATEANIIYINKELNEFDNLKDYNNLTAYIKSKQIKNTKTYLFIDEIHDILNFEKTLRSLQAEGNFDIYITGSNAFMLSGELATYLSGRYIEIKVYGLSYIEFLNFHKLKNSNDSLLKYIKYGGLPYLINLKLDDNLVYNYLKNIYAAILFKDIVARYNIRNVSFLENLVRYTADNVGNIVSSNRISQYLKSQKLSITPNIVLNYLSYLESAYFIFKVLRSDISSKKIFEVGEKYYFEDLGLRHSIVGYRQTDIGKILENIVFLHLKLNDYNIKIGYSSGKEIDFICEKNGDKLYIQVTYQITEEQTREREFGNLLAVKDNYRKIVISMDEFTGKSYKGIEHIHIKDFLSEYI